MALGSKTPSTIVSMPFMVGGIAVVSERSYIEWKIRDFFTQTDNRFTLQSDYFSAMGCSWNLKMCPDADCYQVCLQRRGMGFDVKPMAITFGFKKADGTLREWRSIQLEKYFSKGDFSCKLGIIRPDEWKKHKSEITSTGSVELTLRMERGTPIPEISDPSPQEVETQQTNLAELDALSSDLRDLLNTGRKHDVTINVQGKKFRAHRTVLSARSSVFRAMYEHETSEEETGYLTIPDCDPESFSDFLGYIYTGKVEEMSFRTANYLYSTAEKYDVQHLKAFCADHMKRNLTTENVCQVIVLADQYCDRVLMSSAQEFFNKYFSKIFLTPQWKMMLRTNLRLVDKLLEGMNPAGSNNP